MADAQENLFPMDPCSPADYLKQLLADRGWTQEELATITGRSRQQIIDLMSGRRGITAEMAISLAAAFGNHPSFWLNIDSAYRLAKTPGDFDEVQKRALLFQIAPIKEMQKRGWLKPTTTTKDLESQLKEFFEVESLDQPPEFPTAMRKRNPLAGLNALQRVWCFRARKVAQAMQVQKFDESKLESFKKELRILAAYIGESGRVPELMRQHGIRFVVVQPLPGSSVDGATFWLDDSSPVIAMSLLHDRFDNFWFTLMHEFCHVQNKDAISVDTDLSAETRTQPLMKDEIERRADQQAEAALIPPEELDSFIRRVGPIYAKPNIIQFAKRIKIHPDIVVGQLQHRGELGFNRKMLAKIREHLVGVALTDGWGNEISPETI
jgi:HTH-type transcriptional regulator/antitoxin HigA